MIHDAIVPVTCDGPHCNDEQNIQPDYLYHSYSGNSGQYDVEDSSIEKILEDECDWIIKDGKHYCSEDCAKEAEDDS